MSKNKRMKQRAEQKRREKRREELLLRDAERKLDMFDPELARKRAIEGREQDPREPRPD